MSEITQHGILPPGIHEMKLEEVGKLFGYIPGASNRLRLLETLKMYVERLQILQIGIALIVDGSCVMTRVEKPVDIDVVLIMPKEWRHTIETIPPERYNLLSPENVETEFPGIHLFAITEHSPKYYDWIRYFPTSKTTGILCLTFPMTSRKDLYE